MAKKKNAEKWKEAKKKCRLNQADIQMAKELGLNPKSLIRNIPGPKELWKAPVKDWISELYGKKFGKVLTVKPQHNKGSNKKQDKVKEPFYTEDWEDLPF
ncbi:hypothetical protein [Gracilibacillus salinarum]|uniref:Phage protein n=1 Tax=Gracilibacillus salinarum TaxID=2932255 RepID=A0ABY4GGM2_9BACI|nr:hypothetical protein [Gracilibacillus salinarum]UOQ83468.1 hypothetical protein MUN87_11915 [Gracilibacillus salinarum]